MAASFGEFVRSERERRGMSPAWLAERIHRTPSYVSRLETNQIKTPPPDVVADIARALGVSEVTLVRLIGYLSTVPEGELPSRWEDLADATELALLERYRRLSPEERSGMHVVFAVMVGDRHPLIPPGLAVVADELPVS